MSLMTRVILGVSLLLSVGFSATRSDINTIESAERTRYLSQKIAKDYLYLYARPKLTHLKTGLEHTLDELSDTFTAIASSTRDSDSKDLLKYLKYTHENIRKLLTEKPSRRTALSMLAYSEILLEGAEFILKEHQYTFAPNEAMLMGIKKDEYLIERLTKYYMLTHLGKIDPEIHKKMLRTSKELSQGFGTILSYQYPPELQKLKKDLSLFWNASGYMLAHASDIFAPSLVDITSSHFEQLMVQFSLYHSKSQ